MEELIKIAIEGGYKGTNKITDAIFQSQGDHLVLKMYYLGMVCDPLFYQALGKACGWNKNTGEEKGKQILRIENHTYYADDDIGHALRTFEIILTEGMDKGIEYLKSIVVK